MNTLLLILTAYVGGRVGIWLRLPAGAILGSMILVAMVKTADVISFSDISPLIRLGSQVVLGTMIGLLFSKKILALPLNLMMALTLLGFASIIISSILAGIFSVLEILPFITGLISTSPTGIAEMITLSESIQAQTQAVVVVHLIRFVFIILILRWFIAMVSKRLGRSGQ